MKDDCTTHEGKIGFSTKPAAERSIRTIKRHSKSGHARPVRAYYCRGGCRTWFVTSAREDG